MCSPGQWTFKYWLVFRKVRNKDCGAAGPEGLLSWVVSELHCLKERRVTLPRRTTNYKAIKFQLISISRERGRGVRGRGRRPQGLPSIAPDNRRHQGPLRLSRVPGLASPEALNLGISTTLVSPLAQAQVTRRESAPGRGGGGGAHARARARPLRVHPRTRAHARSRAHWET